MRIIYCGACSRILFKVLLALLVLDLGLVNGHPVKPTSNMEEQSLTRHKFVMLSKRGPAKTTYIAVVVGVVGTLALLSLGICLDIWRRRRRSLARQLEEDQGPRDPSFYARFPPLPGEPDNTLMQEHQSHSPPTRPTPPLHASVALPEAVYAGHVQSTRPITSSGTMQDSDDEKSPPSPGKEKPLFDEPQFISNAGAPIGPQEKSGLTPTS